MQAVVLSLLPLLLVVYMTTCYAAPIKLGFVYVLTTQTESGGMQKPLHWEKFFNGSSSRNNYASILVNWPFKVPLPNFASETMGHETDYGGIRYIETYLTAAEILINKYNVDGVMLLSGSCLPIRSFNQLHNYLTPILSDQRSVLPEEITNNTGHLKRFQRLKTSKVPMKQWRIHQAQGYCLHKSLIQFMLSRWTEYRKEIADQRFFDEHYVTYFLHSLANNESDRDYLKATNFIKTLVLNGMMYDDWSQTKGGTHPTVWRDSLTQELIDKIRKQPNYFFMRKVASSCKIPFKLF
jgi:acyl-CoA thioesterase FadM